MTTINEFYAYFPDNLNELVHRAEWLLKTFGNEPNYLRVFDKSGTARHVIWQIEAIHGSPIDSRQFAAGFDTAARILRERTGALVGWGIDPTPLPPYGTHEGPDPVALRNAESIVMINPYNITSQGPGAPKPENQITENERMAYARNITATWTNSGIPYVATIIPGFDAHLVRPGQPAYGFHAEWLRQQRILAVDNGNAGVAFDPVNGFTEGRTIYPTVEDGDTIARWARETVAAHHIRWDSMP